MWIQQMDKKLQTHHQPASSKAHQSSIEISLSFSYFNIPYQMPQFVGSNAKPLNKEEKQLTHWNQRGQYDYNSNNSKQNQLTENAQSIKHNLITKITKQHQKSNDFRISQLYKVKVKLPSSSPLQSHFRKPNPQQVSSKLQSKSKIRKSKRVKT